MKNFLQSFLTLSFLIVFSIKTIHAQADWTVTGNAAGTPEISKIVINELVASICTKTATNNLPTAAGLDGEYILPNGTMGVGAGYEFPSTWPTVTSNCTANAGQDQELNCNVFAAFIGSTSSVTSTYIWSNGVTTAIQQVTTPGTYSLTVTDATGCVATDAVVVTQDNTPPTVNITSSNGFYLTCTIPATTLTASGGGVYTWNNGSTQSNINVANPGTYTVTVTNFINGCITSQNIVISEDKASPTAVIAPPPPLTCINPIVILNTSGTSTGTNFVYAWSGPNNFSSTSLTPSAVSIAGTYTITVTNTINGCKKIASTTLVANNSGVIANAGPDKTIDCNFPQVAIGTAAVAGNTYLWSNNSTSATQSVTVAGTYNLTVTNTASGCTATDNVVVFVNNTPPIATISNSNGLNLNCTTITTTLTASGGGTYVWSNGLTQSNINVANPGTYTVTVTGANGCTSTASITVTSNTTAPIANITSNNGLNLNCNTPSTALTASGGSAYVWSNNSNLSNINVTNPGNYTVTVTAANGCTATKSVTVTLNNIPPTVSIATPALLTCQNQTTQLNATASTGTTITYMWSTSNGNIISGTNTLTPIVSKAGTYTLIVTDAATGCTKSASVSVVSDANIPIANAGSDKVLTCNANVVALDGTGSSTGANFSYLWTTPTGTSGIVAGGTTLFPAVNKPILYSLVVTNTTNGCSASDAVVVTQNTTPPTIAIKSNSPVCVSSTLTLTASGANSYQWTGVNSFTSNNSTVSILNITASNSGVYTVVGTNTATGCSAIASTTVQVQNAYVTAYDIALMKAGSSRTYNLKPAILKANPKVIGNPIPKSVKLYYPTSGNYSLKIPYIIDSTGCSGLVVLYIKVTKNGVGTKPGNLDNDSDNELDINVEVLNESINIFPNPSEGIFQISVPKSMKSYRTRVFDVTGKVILNGVNINEIDLNGFSNGVYFLNIKNEDREEMVKLIKI